MCSANPNNHKDTIMPKFDETYKTIFRYVEERESSDPGFLKAIKAMYNHNAKWSNSLISLLVHSCTPLFKPKEKKIKYFFWGNKYSDIIKSLPAKETCIIGGPKQALFCIKHRVKFIPCMSLWHILEDGLEHNNGVQKKLFKKMNALSKQLARSKHENASLIVDNDSLPMQRTAIISARTAGIKKTICIQHGIFQSKSPSHIFDGWFADEFFVISPSQKDMLIKKGMNSTTLKVLGFHSNPYKPTRALAEPKKRSICFLGQPWVKYGEARAHRYIEIVELIFMELTTAGINIFYKPHPWEKSCHTFGPHIKTINFSLDRAIEEHDAFISLTSTALFEAHESGRVSIQIVDPAFDSDTFSETNGIHSINFSDFNLINEIKKIISEHDANCLTTQESAGIRFIKTMNQ